MLITSPGLILDLKLDSTSHHFQLLFLFAALHIAFPLIKRDSKAIRLDFGRLKNTYDFIIFISFFTLYLKIIACRVVSIFAYFSLHKKIMFIVAALVITVLV